MDPRIDPKEFLVALQRVEMHSLMHFGQSYKGLSGSKCGEPREIEVIKSRRPGEVGWCHGSIDLEQLDEILNGEHDYEFVYNDETLVYDVKKVPDGDMEPILRVQRPAEKAAGNINQ